MKLNPSREFRSSATSVIVSVIIHVAIIVLFASLFFAGRLSQTISLTANSLDDDFLPSFESNPSETESFEEALDESLFEPTEDEETVEEDWDSLMEESVEEFFPAGKRNIKPMPLPKQTGSFDHGPGFFGIQPTGNRIVFIIDNSHSMGYRDRYSERFDIATREVMATLDELTEEQSFFVICFCFRKKTMSIGNKDHEFLPPTRANKQKLRNWFNGVKLGSGTDPREAIVEALELYPSCVYLLSDGEFNGVHYDNKPYRREISAVELARKFNKFNCPIHTIGLHDRGNQEALETIAADSGGVYQFVPRTK